VAVILTAGIPMCAAEDVDVLVASTYSNPSDDNTSIRGIYDFTNVPDGTYNLTTVKDMNEINSGMQFWMAGYQVTVVNGQSLTDVNISMEQENNSAWAEAMRDIINSSSLVSLTGNASISGRTGSYMGHETGFTSIRGCDVGLWQVMDLPDGIVDITTSDAEGDYNFSDVPDGYYELTSAKYLAGMGNWEYGITNVTIADGQVVTEDILMSFVYDNETIEKAQSVTATSGYILTPLVGNGGISGKIQMNGMGGGLANIKGATVILCETEKPNDWNPWNDLDSDGLPDGSYITLGEVTEAYNCYVNSMPAPETGASISLNIVLQLYNAYVNVTPM
jgi:hypothetical protein